MLNTVTASAGSFISNVIAADVEAPANDLNPIALELKELVWGFGAFVVFAVLLRYVLWPPLKASIEARDQRVIDDLAAAEAVTAGAQGDVTEYEAQRAAARAEAQRHVEAARATLEAERTERIAEANARIAERRAAALAEVEAAREAAQSEVEAAVHAVASTAARLAAGREADPEVVRRAVADAMNAGAAR